MKVISVDDERLILEDFVEMLEEMKEIDEVKGFTSCSEAFEYIKKEHVDVAFLDIHMREMSGIELAKKIKIARPQVNIIFLTAYDEYTMDAMKLHASGYLMKPADEDAVREELHRKFLSIEARQRIVLIRHTLPLKKIGRAHV